MDLRRLFVFVWVQLAQWLKSYCEKGADFRVCVRVSKMVILCDLLSVAQCTSSLGGLIACAHVVGIVFWCVVRWGVNESTGVEGLK